MICGNCKAPARVIGSISRDGHTWRRYVCTSCRATFCTMETETPYAWRDYHVERRNRLYYLRKEKENHDS